MTHLCGKTVSIRKNMIFGNSDTVSSINDSVEEKLFSRLKGNLLFCG